MLANCLRTCLAAKPKEHKPCKMGALKPEREGPRAPASSINETQTQFDLKSHKTKTQNNNNLQSWSGWRRSLTSHGSEAGIYVQRVPVPTQAVQSSLEPQDRRVGAPSPTAELSRRTCEISINQPDSFKAGAKIRKDPLFEVMLLLVISIPGGIFFFYPVCCCITLGSSDTFLR